MPTYEYRCPDGHTFEKFYRKISDASGEVPCPECGKAAERLMSAGAGLLFKGSGFYLTDYGKNAHRKAGPTSKSGDGAGESGGAGAAGDKTGGGAKSGLESGGSTSARSSDSAPTGDAASTPKPAPKPKSDS